MYRFGRLISRRNERERERREEDQKRKKEDEERRLEEERIRRRFQILHMQCILLVFGIQQCEKKWLTVWKLVIC